MFHVPGTYSGASTDAFSWTQTKEAIELTVPLAADACGAVQFATRTLRVAAADDKDAPPVLEGALHDVIIEAESVWTRDDNPRQFTISLRKAVPAVWPRLLAADPE
jgi:hypothetical protein